MLIHRQLGKEDVVRIHNRVLLSHEKPHEILPLATTWTDLERIVRIVLSQLSQTETNTTRPHLHVGSKETNDWYILNSATQHIPCPSLSCAAWDSVTYD